MNGELRPKWLRYWHTAQALAIFGLLATGLSMHYSDVDLVLIPFETAVEAHNILGIITGVLWIVFGITNALSGNIRFYRLSAHNFLSDSICQMRYYLKGMFVGDPPPFEPSPKEKFNPLQKLSYAMAMYLLIPGALITGLILLAPILVPDHVLGNSGLWPVALAHLSMGYLLSIFLLTHMYLATTGDTVSSLTKDIFLGTSCSEKAPPSSEKVSTAIKDGPGELQ